VDPQLQRSLHTSQLASPSIDWNSSWFKCIAFSLKCFGLHWLSFRLLLQQSAPKYQDHPSPNLCNWQQNWSCWFGAAAGCADDCIHRKKWKRTYPCVVVRAHSLKVLNRGEWLRSHRTVHRFR
jgi:hypothetical protein